MQKLHEKMNEISKIHASIIPYIEPEIAYFRQFLKIFC